MHTKAVVLLCALALAPGACRKAASHTAGDQDRPEDMSRSDRDRAYDCHAQKDPDRLAAGECTAAKTGSLTNGLYKLATHNRVGRDVGCWALVSPDHIESIGTYTGVDSNNIPNYFITRQWVPTYSCRMQASSNNYNADTSFIQVQGDGNVVFYASDQTDGDRGQNIYASTGTDGHDGAKLVLKSDGGLVVLDATGKQIWPK